MSQPVIIALLSRNRGAYRRHELAHCNGWDHANAAASGPASEQCRSANPTPIKRIRKTTLISRSIQAPLPTLVAIKKTFFDKYGDQIFYGSMLLGTLTSLFAAAWKFMTKKEPNLKTVH